MELVRRASKAVGSLLEATGYTVCKVCTLLDSLSWRPSCEPIAAPVIAPVTPAVAGPALRLLVGSDLTVGSESNYHYAMQVQPKNIIVQWLQSEPERGYVVRPQEQSTKANSRSWGRSNGDRSRNVDSGRCGTATTLFGQLSGDALR